MRPHRIALSTVLCCSMVASFAIARPVLSRTASAHVAGRAPARPQLPESVVVIKRFGAAIRVAPSSNVAVRVTAACGTTAQALDYANGWYQVSYDSSQTVQGGGTLTGWVGAARVADASNPPSYDCTDSYTFQLGQHGYSYVRSGCLSLRAYPSRTAPYHYCVSNFHDYIVTNGPYAAGNDDWFGVSSRSTGSGWVLAQYLLPYRSSAGGTTGGAGGTGTPACDPSALFAAAARKEGFDAHDPGYANLTGDDAAGAAHALCIGAWAIATIGRPRVGATDGDTLFTVSGGQWSEVTVLGYPVTTCRLESLGVPAATAQDFAHRLSFVSSSC